MAGEWIKLDSSTPDKPEVFKIARIIGLDPDAVVGKLLRLWSWIDSVSVDGAVDAVVSTDVDRVCRCIGFASACERVGWLVIDDESERITLPNFDNHNGETAKKRALKNRRQAKWRKGLDACPSTPVDTNASTTASTREEKRREEKKKKDQKPCAAGAARFPDFWTAYPRHEAKKQALEVWVRKRLDERADALIADVERRKREHRPWLDGFVPHAVVFLRNERWDDAIDHGQRDTRRDEPTYLADAL